MTTVLRSQSAEQLGAEEVPVLAAQDKAPGVIVKFGIEVRISTPGEVWQPKKIG
jgi:hypothetical protein